MHKNTIGSFFGIRTARGASHLVVSKPEPPKPSPAERKPRKARKTKAPVVTSPAVLKPQTQSIRPASTSTDWQPPTFDRERPFLSKAQKSTPTNSNVSQPRTGPTSKLIQGGDLEHMPHHRHDDHHDFEGGPDVGFLSNEHLEDVVGFFECEEDT